MGCTSSKENTNPPPTTITDHNQQLINDQFRKWLKSNRPKADEYVLNDIISKIHQPNDIDDYRTIVKKALDLLSDRYDIKTINKLNKLVQKEVSLASPKKVAYTIDILKQTAEKLHHGQIVLDDNQHSTNGNITNDIKTSESKHGQLTSGEPGIVLKEALEKARILFYKGKQAAIFANPNGGYDVRIIDEYDDGLNHDGNLLRSIIVTEVKMRPKPVTTIVPKFTAPPPPPPSSKVLNEHEIGDDFRRSIDAALKGLEAIYHTSAHTSNNEAQQDISQTDFQPKLVGAINDTIETITQSEIGNPIPPTHDDKQEKSVIPNDIEEKHQSKDNLSTKQSASYSMGLTSALQNDESIASISSQQKVRLSKENRDKDGQTSLDESTHSSNPNSITKLGISTSSDKKIEEESIINNQSSRIPTSISQIIEEHNKILSEPSLPPVVSPVDINTTVKSPSHNVTYTEIIHSQSHDGEQSRRFITESYDEHPLKDDDQTTSHTVVTKSEFSNHPLLGEKTMEQSVQVITVKVRNETIKTKTPSQTSDNEISNDHNTIDMTN